MSAPGLPATGRAAAENELLAELGLPPSASPEDVDRVHQAVSDYLASAPRPRSAAGLMRSRRRSTPRTSI